MAMDKKTSLVASWFATTITTLIFAAFFLIYLSSVRVVQPNQQNFKLYAALPKPSMEITTNVSVADARSKIVENFFKDYSSSLSKYSQLFVSVADKYKLDWKLLPSIAMQESGGAKKVIQGSNNPFGYGIYGGLVIKFPTWEEGIERVGRALREDYLDKGLKTPSQIMTKYTPPSLATGGAWAKGVSSFMLELR